LKSIKIGITSIDRYFKRFAEIEKKFGKINQKESYFYTSESMKDIKNIEKSLHLLFWNNAKDIKINGSGKTEFFKETIDKDLKKLLKNIKKIKKIKGPFSLMKRSNINTIAISISLLFIFYFFLVKYDYFF
jgi:hypothetical protein